MFVYLIIKIIQFFLYCLPYKAVLFAGRILGVLGYLLLSNKRRVVSRNLENIQRQDLCLRVFVNAGITLVEVLVLKKIKSKKKDLVKVNIGKINKDIEDGAIFMLSHFNNWEIMEVVASELCGKVLTVGQKIKNKYLDNWIKKSRQNMGVVLVSKKEFIKKSLEFLEKKQMVAVLADQNAGRHGEQLEFLGKTASTFTTPAVLSIRTGKPVIPLFDIRDNKTGKHTIKICDPVYPEGDAIEMTKKLTKILEDMIKKYPESWFWFHRRWKR